MYERANAVSYNSRQLDKYQPNDHRNFRSWFDSMNEIINQPNPVIRFESINPRSDNPDHDNLIKLLKLPVHTHRMQKWRHSPRVSHVCDDDRHCECGDSKHTSKLNIKKKHKAISNRGMCGGAAATATSASTRCMCGNVSVCCHCHITQSSATIFHFINAYVRIC